MLTQWLAGLIHPFFVWLSNLDAFGPFHRSAESAQLGAALNRNKATTCTLQRKIFYYLSDKFHGLRSILRSSLSAFEYFNVWNIWLRWSQGNTALQQGFGALMRQLPPFLASEESDPSRSGMSGPAQASVLPDADGYIINMPSATLLEFNVSSQSH